MVNQRPTEEEVAASEAPRLRGHLHPVSFLFVALQFAKHGAAPLLASWVALKGETFAWVMLAAVLAVGLGAALQMWRYRFEIREGGLHVQEGVLGKTTRHIPLSRIVAVSQSRQLLHRLFGVAEVHLESAAGGKPEAVMRVLSLAQAEALRERIFAGATRHLGSVPQVAPEAEPLFKMAPTEVFKLGLFSHRGMVLVGVAMATIMPKDEFRRPFMNAMEVPLNALLSLVEPLVAGGRWGVLVAELLLVALVALLLVQCFSVAIAFARYHRFSLTQQGARWVVHRGLSTQINSSAAPSRMQAWQIRQTGLERLWGYGELSVTVPGDVDHDDQGLNAAGRFAELAPLAPWPQLLVLLERSAPGLAWSALQWQPLGKKAMARALWGEVRWLLPLAAMAVAALWLWPRWQGAGVWVLPGLLVLTVFSLARQVLQVRSAGVAEQGPWLVFRRGFWTRHWTVIDARRLQQISLYSSGLDRHFGLAHLRADAQGPRMKGRALDIPSLDLAQAQRLRAQCWAQMQVPLT